MDIARVENGQIVEGPMRIPAAWKNVSGFNLLPVERIRAYGWLPVYDGAPPSYDPKIERPAVSGYEIWSDSVTRTWATAPLSADEIQKIAAAAAKADAIETNLPSRAAAHAAVDNIGSLADSKVFLHKLVDVLYWLAKNRAD